MADGIQLTGRVEVMIQLAVGAGQLVKLGECLDMADVEDRAFYNNISGDRYGGPQGPPIDCQYLGSIYVVRCELSRWDPAVFDALKLRKANATAGKILLSEVGTLMLASNTFRLLLKSATRPLNFPTAILRDSLQFSMGTKFTSLSLQFECHRCPDGLTRGGADYSGILYNAVTTEYAT